MTVLEPGDAVYGGLPGQSAYYAPRNVLDAADGSNASFFQSVQAEAHPIKGYRPEVGEFIVKERIQVPTGSALNNLQYGVGGADQFFIRSYQQSLELQKTIPFK